METKGTRLTGLWKNTTKDGRSYLSGSLGLSKLVVWKNDRKEKPTAPDYFVYLVPSEAKKKPPATTEQGDF